VTQGAGLSLQWYRNNLLPAIDYNRLSEEAATDRHVVRPAPAG
jgi:hypothetical protein